MNQSRIFDNDDDGKTTLITSYTIILISLFIFLYQPMQIGTYHTPKMVIKLTSIWNRIHTPAYQFPLVILSVRIEVK